MARKTAVSILEDARASIKVSTWICGALDTCNVTKKGKLKHMACAMGIVSLAAGGKAVRKRTSTVPVGSLKWSHEHGEYDYDDYPEESTVITTYFATYPDEKWSQAAKEATKFLALAIPENAGVHGQEYLPEYAAGERLVYPSLGSNETYPPYGEIALRAYSNSITDYNDSHIKSAAEARKWFTNAIKLARKSA